MHEYGFFQPVDIPERGTPRFFVDFFLQNTRQFLQFLGFSAGVHVNADQLSCSEHQAFLYYSSKKQLMVLSPVVGVRTSITSGFVVFQKAIERDVVLCGFTQDELLLLFWNNFFGQLRAYLFAQNKLSRDAYIQRTSYIDNFVEQYVDRCNMLAFVTSPKEHPNLPTIQEMDAAIISCFCQMIIFSQRQWSLKCELIRNVLFFRQDMFEIDPFFLDFLPASLVDDEESLDSIYRC